MIRNMLIVSVFFVVSISGTSQQTYTAADVFKVDQITWFGLDFTHIRLIDRLGFTYPDTIVERYFASINTLVLNEPRKYSIKKFFYKKEVEINLEIVSERNKCIDPDVLVLDANEQYTIDKDSIKQIIAEYKQEGTEGIGVVFIMESFNKKEKLGHMWVTFFDMASSQVLFTAKMQGKAGGFGWRNYWVKTCYKVMKNIQNHQYSLWKNYYL